MHERTRIATAENPEPAAPCCDVTASQPTPSKPGQTARFHFFASGIHQSPFRGCRNGFSSRSAEINPSGSAPRLYSAIRFFHFRKSVILCGSMRTSTRRRLARSRFISCWKPTAERRFFADRFVVLISRPQTQAVPNRGEGPRPGSSPAAQGNSAPSRRRSLVAAGSAWRGRRENPRASSCILRGRNGRPFSIQSHLAFRR